MPFNGLTNGDFTKAPWAGGCMTLTHEECVFVLDKCQTIIDKYDPKNNQNQPISDTYVQSEYNKLDWEKAINGDTYAVLLGYGENTLGIDENGIVQENEIPVE
jgi:hypothetical protein